MSLTPVQTVMLAMVVGEPDERVRLEIAERLEEIARVERQCPACFSWPEVTPDETRWVNVVEQHHHACPRNAD